jgi:hypothetical protein
MGLINLDYNQIESQLSTLKVSNWNNEASFRDFLFKQVNKYRNLHKYPLDNFCFVNMHYLRPKSDKTVEGVNNRIRIPIHAESQLNNLLSEYEPTVTKYDSTSDHFASLMIRDDWPNALNFYLNMKEEEKSSGDNIICVSKNIIEVLKNVDIDVDPDTFDDQINSTEFEGIKSNLSKISIKLCSSCRNTSCSKGTQLLKEMFGTFNLTLRAINGSYFNDADGIYITLLPLQIKYDLGDDVIAVLIHISKIHQISIEDLSKIHQLFLPFIHGIHHREFLLSKRSEELKELEGPKNEFRSRIQQVFSPPITKLKSNIERFNHSQGNHQYEISKFEKDIGDLQKQMHKYYTLLSKVYNREQLNQLRKNLEGELYER